jgi:hypothetical protein
MHLLGEVPGKLDYLNIRMLLNLCYTSFILSYASITDDFVLSIHVHRKVQ